MPYNYKGKIKRVIDGDTVVVEMDLGFRIFLTEKMRLYGIDAPELIGSTSDAGKKAKQYLIDLVLDRDVDIITHKNQQDKYGRWLVTIYIGDKNINKELITANHAVEKYY